MECASFDDARALGRASMSRAISASFAVISASFAAITAFSAAISESAIASAAHKTSWPDVGSDLRRESSKWNK
tara:strand:- start:97 stop:315 length:219 start_codon:yes stop_codon:yes gene_type:complete